MAIAKLQHNDATEDMVPRILLKLIQKGRTRSEMGILSKNGQDKILRLTVRYLVRHLILGCTVYCRSHDANDTPKATSS